jgi:DNA-binding IclR family transcriptional regulator
MSHTEIGDALGIPKSSLTNLLRNLEARNYLQLVPGPNTYELGPALFSLARAARSKRDLFDIAKTFVERVTAKTNESAAFNIVRGREQVECVFGANSSQPLQFIMQVGQVAPLHAVSSGKAILAFLPTAERETYLKNLPASKITSSTKTSVDAISKDLKKIAREGVAYSYEEFTPGIVGVGVPVLDAQGLPVGAINVAVPAIRFDRARGDELADALRNAARALERELGVGLK